MKKDQKIRQKLRALAKAFGGKIRYRDSVDNGQSLGTADSYTGDIEIARRWQSTITGRWHKIPEDTQVFVIAHEIGHLIQIECTDLFERLHSDRARWVLDEYRTNGISSVAKRTLIRHMRNLHLFEIDADERGMNILKTLGAWTDGMEKELRETYHYFYRLWAAIETGYILNMKLDELPPRLDLHHRSGKLKRSVLNRYIKLIHRTDTPKTEAPAADPDRIRDLTEG
jgi:hypothetical protein